MTNISIYTILEGVRFDDSEPHEHGPAVRTHSESVRQAAAAQRLLGPVPQGTHVRGRPGGVRQCQVGSSSGTSNDSSSTSNDSSNGTSIDSSIGSSSGGGCSDSTAVRRQVMLLSLVLLTTI